MAMIGETDPRVQALFDENLARTRRATAEVSAELKAGQDRVAADIEAREEKHKRDIADAGESAENLAKQGDKQPRKPQWERPDRGAGEMAFGPEDDDGGYVPPPSAPVPVVPPAPPVVPVAPPPPVRSRRPAPVDDDDDLSGQTWLS
jgi:hypothetical protein